MLKLCLCVQKRFFSQTWRAKIQTLPERYPQYQIGRETYSDSSMETWGEGSTLSIGNFTSIVTGVKILLGGERRTDWATTFHFSVLRKKDVVIGSDV